MKIVHITTVDLSLRYLLLNQLCSLRQAGYQVTGISTYGPDVPIVEAAGIRHIAVPMARRAFTPLADLGALWQLYRILHRENFIIVHTHTPKAGLLGRWAAKLAGIPIIVHTNHGFVFHEHSPSLWRLFFITLEKIAARCSDLIFSVNQEDMQTALHEGICTNNQIISLGRGGIGIDMVRFDPACLSIDDRKRKRREVGLPEASQVIGFVGRLVREKGLLDLFKAMQIVRLRVPNVRLLVIGPVDAEKPDALTPAKATEYGIIDICHFLGMRQDMPELYSVMDVFVLPSYREGFPVSPMEASAMQVPCIVTDIRGSREVVEQGRNGLIIPLNDVQALAGAIVELLSNSAKAERMGEEGRKLALERFDERLVFEKVKAEYARLLHKNGLIVPQSRNENQGTMI